MSSQGPGSGYVPPWGVVVLGALLLSVAGLSIYSLVQFWPPATTATNAGQQAAATVAWFPWNLSVPRDSAFFVVVLAAGSLGASVHALRSLGWYVGNRNMRQSWVPSLLLLPMVGALLALLAYLVVRAGLVSGPLSSEAVSPFGFVALAGLVGLFTDQTIGKLKAVFETLLAPAPTGADHSPGAAPTGADHSSVAAPLIDWLSATSGAAGTELRIRGSNLAQVTQAFFGDQPVIPLAVSGSEVVVTVPSGAATGPVSLVGPNGKAISAETFEIT